MEKSISISNDCKYIGSFREKKLLLNSVSLHTVQLLQERRTLHLYKFALFPEVRIVAAKNVRNIITFQ